MDWQTSADTVPSSFITDAQVRSVVGKPPATGAWRDGDDPGERAFASVGSMTVESGEELASARIAFETWGELSSARDNALLILHALTGDSHVRGDAGVGHRTPGWWSDIVGPGLAIDTNEWFVVAPNMLGGCQGSTGPASLAPDGQEWGTRFPYLTIRDQVQAQAIFADTIGIKHWAAVVGGSMGGMHALEWAVSFPDRVERLALIAAPPVSTADQIAGNSLQLEAIRMDPLFNAGEYYDSPRGEGPHRGLALARRMALVNYRSAHELNDRFGSSWQSNISPLGAGGRFAVESYLDFHGNKFTRRFDANSYITLVHAMNSHDIGRERGGIRAALQRVTALSLVVGIDSDRLFPLPGQHTIAEHLPNNLDGADAVVLSSDYGHDGFLIEIDGIGRQLQRLLQR